MNGRKRHIPVDTIGLILGVVVHAASIQDRDGAKLLFEKVKGGFPRLHLVWADGGYAGKLISWLSDFFQWTLEDCQSQRTKGILCTSMVVGR